MKLIILDHLKRWRSVWVLYAILQLVACWFISTGTPQSNDFVISMFAIFLGPFLLQFDLQRGFVRTLTTLPLTNRQIGRAWWLVTVGLPVIMLSLLAFLSAEIFHLLHPAGSFRGEWLAMSSLVTLAFLGTGFFILQNFANTPGGSWWDKVRNTVFGILWGGIIGGWLLVSKFIFDSTEKTIWALGIGLLATFAGWFNAEQMVLQRASFKLITKTSNKKSAPLKIPRGFGGLPYLAQRTFIQSTLIGLALMAFMILFMSFASKGHNRPEAIISMLKGGSTPYIFYILLFSIVPLVFQLRFLRTLPISPPVLAATLIFLPILSIAAVGIIVAIIASLLAGESLVLPTANSFLLLGAKATIMVPAIVWRGLDAVTYFLIFLLAIADSFITLGLTIIFHLGFKTPEHPLWINLTIFLLCAVGSLAMTIRLLAKSSSAYRVRTMPLNIWSMARR